MPRGIKQDNNYIEALPEMYRNTPKSVWAALAISLVLRLNEDDFNAVSSELRSEWQVLYEQGIVPQRPPHTALPCNQSPQQVEVERLRGLITRAYHVITNPDRQPFSRELIEVLQEMEKVIDMTTDATTETHTPF